jgi:hypothetical protein
MIILDPIFYRTLFYDFRPVISPGPSPTRDSGSHAPTQSRGTKRDSSYEHLSQGIPVFTSVEENDGQVGEWIKNFSLDQVLGGDTGSLSPLYDDLKSFISKVPYTMS